MSQDSDSVPELRILVADLPKGDLARLAVFLRVRSDRLQRGWQIVAQAPADVYIHDADEPPTIPGCIEDPTVQVRVADTALDTEPGPWLARPLQYDAFVDVLAAAEHRLLQHRAGTPVAAPRASAAPADRNATASAPVAQPLGQQRFRLRRWPGALLLQKSRYGVRMASFISARFLSVEELSRLSGVEPGECAQFLSSLMDSTLLRAEPASSEPAAGIPTASATLPSDAAAALPPRPSRSLLSSLRHRLGIGAR